MKKKNFNKSLPPIDCGCGCESTEKKNIVTRKNKEVCFTLHCQHCDMYLGSFMYGKWEY